VEDLNTFLNLVIPITNARCHKSWFWGDVLHDNIYFFQTMIIIAFHVSIPYGSVY